MNGMNSESGGDVMCRAVWLISEGVRFHHAASDQISSPVRV